MSAALVRALRESREAMRLHVGEAVVDAAYRECGRALRAVEEGRPDALALVERALSSIRAAVSARTP